MLSNEYYLQIFHEVKNSVTLINSYMQLIEKKYPEINSCDYWSSARSETTRLRSIATEISQLKFGSNLQLEKLDIRNFITDCCNSFRHLHEAFDISFTISLPEQPIIVAIDPRQLRHAITNLLKNACEAMQFQGIIRATVTLENQSLQIQITDSGCGIAPELLANIFDPFITTKEDGSGLGLNITRQIMKAHNGDVNVTSTEGKGSTFTLTLPY